MTDSQVGARVSKEVETTLKKIADKINNEHPGAGASTSTIIRAAITEFIERHYSEFLK